jgi:glycosyltransferase involved in cell wall biosynthesis
MRLVLVSFVEDTMSTGMGKWSHRVAQIFRAHGHEVELWFSDDFPLMRHTGRLGVLLFPPYLALRLAREGGSFDVAVLHEPIGFWSAVLRHAGVPGVPPIVCMSHNVESRNLSDLLDATQRGLANVGLGSRIKSAIARRWQSDGALRLADRVVCLSTSDRNYIVDVLSVPAERVTLMVNGVSVDGLSSAPNRKKRRRRILFVGGWHDVKGRRVLPSVWAKVRRLLPDASLTAVGVGNAAGASKRALDPKNCGGVTIVERVSDEARMRIVMATHDVLVMPSLSEGSPLALLEAMASGIPVVAARVGGILDIVHHGVNGLLFDAGDSDTAAELLVRVLLDHTLARELGEGARTRAAELTWEKAGMTLITACQRAIEAATLT